jgi:hypothetical protein
MIDDYLIQNPQKPPKGECPVHLVFIQLEHGADQYMKRIALPQESRDIIPITLRVEYGRYYN